jgi:hypothetical protein
VVYIIFVEAGFFNLFWCKITGKLMHNGTDDFKVSQFVGTKMVSVKEKPLNPGDSRL